MSSLPPFHMLRRIEGPLPPEPSPVQAGAQALWEAMPYLCDDYSYEWFQKVARIVLEAQE